MNFQDSDTREKMVWMLCLRKSTLNFQQKPGNRSKHVVTRERQLKMLYINNNDKSIFDKKTYFCKTFYSQNFSESIPQNSVLFIYMYCFKFLPWYILINNEQNQFLVHPLFTNKEYLSRTVLGQLRGCLEELGQG